MTLSIRRSGWAGALVWWLAAAMLLPWLAGCATPPPGQQARLAGIVVDGVRLARDDDEAAALVRVWRDGQALPVRVGMRLQDGDRIATGASAEAVLRYPGGTELYLRPDSRGRIGSFTEALGEMFAKVWGVFSIETEYVKAGTRGTAFAVRAAPDGTTSVLVLNGSVEISSRTGAWRPLLLQAGSAALAHPQPPRPRQASADELQATRDWVERLEKLVPAERGGARGAGAAAALAIGAMVAILLSQRDGRSASGDESRPAPQTTPPAPAPLAAPTSLRPGTPQAERAPTLDCRTPLTLSWNAVAGARDYQPTLEALSPRLGNWQPLQMAPVTGPRTAAPAALTGSVRWTVRARDARGAGPAAPWHHVNCSTGSVIR